MSNKKTELAPASAWETTTQKAKNATTFYEVKRRLVGEPTEKRGTQLVGTLKKVVQCFFVCWFACQELQAAPTPTPPIIITTTRSIMKNKIEDERIVFIFSDTQIIFQICEDSEFTILSVQKHEFDGMFHTFHTQNGLYLVTPNGEVIHKLGEGKKEYITSNTKP